MLRRAALLARTRGTETRRKRASAAVRKRRGASNVRACEAARLQPAGRSITTNEGHASDAWLFPGVYPLFGAIAVAGGLIVRYAPGYFTLPK
jgi:hypothetical protein